MWLIRTFTLNTSRMEVFREAATREAILKNKNPCEKNDGNVRFGIGRMLVLFDFVEVSLRVTAETFLTRYDTRSIFMWGESEPLR